MIAVQKYPLLPDLNKYHLPIGAKLLSVHEQSGGIYLWALVDTETPEIETFQILVTGTGHKITNPNSPVPMRFLGTIHMRDGINAGLVFHAFEIV